jgi:hypothetical protein
LNSFEENGDFFSLKARISTSVLICSLISLSAIFLSYICCLLNPFKLLSIKNILTVYPCCFMIPFYINIWIKASFYYSSVRPIYFLDSSALYDLSQCVNINAKWFIKFGPNISRKSESICFIGSFILQSVPFTTMNIALTY